MTYIESASHELSSGSDHCVSTKRRKKPVHSECTATGRPSEISLVKPARNKRRKISATLGRAMGLFVKRSRRSNWLYVTRIPGTLAATSALRRDTTPRRASPFDIECDSDYDRSRRN